MRLTRFVEFGRKIVCVGKNYGKHAQEMGGKVPDKPLIFLKPGLSWLESQWFDKTLFHNIVSLIATAYVTEGNPIKWVHTLSLSLSLHL